MAGIDFSGISGVLTATADAIREKTGTAGQIAAKEFAAAIRNISGDGRCISGTVTPTQTNTTVLLECGFRPAGIILCAQEPETAGMYSLTFYSCSGGRVLRISQNAAGASWKGVATYLGYDEQTELTLTDTGAAYCAGNYYRLVAGTTYEWTAWGEG